MDVQNIWEFSNFSIRQEVRVLRLAAFGEKRIYVSLLDQNRKNKGVVFLDPVEARGIALKLLLLSRESENNMLNGLFMTENPSLSSREEQSNE